MKVIKPDTSSEVRHLASMLHLQPEECSHGHHGHRAYKKRKSNKLFSGELTAKA